MLDHSIERIRELPDSVLLSLVHSSEGEAYDNITTVLRERGYIFKGYHFTKDINESGPVDELYKKIYGDK